MKNTKMLNVLLEPANWCCIKLLMTLNDDDRSIRILKSNLCRNNEN